MRICIIVHSQTGNTLSVARKLERRLVSSGHEVTLESISATDEKAIDAKSVVLDRMPDVSGYDALILAGHVRGFSISPAMGAFMSKVDGIDGMKVALFVTHFLPFSWMGGTSAIGQMKSACISKGANVCSTVIIDWKGAGRERKIELLVEEISSCFA
jgi:NAD(P)H dehydrogenase (quinone)